MMKDFWEVKRELEYLYCGKKLPKEDQTAKIVVEFSNRHKMIGLNKDMKPINDYNFTLFLLDNLAQTGRCPTYQMALTQLKKQNLYVQYNKAQPIGQYTNEINKVLGLESRLKTIPKHLISLDLKNLIEIWHTIYTSTPDIPKLKNEIESTTFEQVEIASNVQDILPIMCLSINDKNQGVYSINYTKTAIEHYNLYNTWVTREQLEDYFTKQKKSFKIKNTC